MKIKLKTEEQIQMIKQSGDILTKTIGLIGKNIKPGISLLELDKMAEEYIKDNGGIPACKNYGGFPNTLCLSVNDIVLHGIPNKYILKDGDIISVDSVVNYKGYYSDCTYTYGVGNINDENKRLLNVTKQSLFEAINVAKVNNSIGKISSTIESHIKKHGYYIIEDYGGHGIGLEMHEDPVVPNSGKENQGIKIFNGLVIAIEPIVAVSTSKTKALTGYHNIATVNGCMSAHYEATVGFINNKTVILTDIKNCEI